MSEIKLITSSGLEKVTTTEKWHQWAVIESNYDKLSKNKIAFDIDSNGNIITLKNMLSESDKQKENNKVLLQGIYIKQDALRDKMLKNDYKYRIKSPETYEQYKAVYDEEMKVLILQEDELKTAIDGK